MDLENTGKNPFTIQPVKEPRYNAYLEKIIQDVKISYPRDGFRASHFDR
jgi:hypothetical protein